MAATTTSKRFVAGRELLALARSRVTAEDIADWAPNDPGYHDYVTAFRAIVERGESAIENTFDVTETIGLTRWTNATQPHYDARFRWFRILTCAVHVLLDDDDVPHYSAVTLIVDTLALGDDGPPLDLLARVFHEQADVEYASPEVRWCQLAELLVTREPSALLALLDEHAHELWTTFFDQLHPVWLDLIAARCPSAELRDRLLADGARWRDEPRVTS